MYTLHPGRTPHGVRGLKYEGEVVPVFRDGRTPHGVRGLKSLVRLPFMRIVWSHPSRGAWIEITDESDTVTISSGRTPHGVRGLKSATAVTCSPTTPSHPSRGAWIEIPASRFGRCRLPPSHPSRGAWIEIAGLRSIYCSCHSRTPHGVRGLK